MTVSRERAPARDAIRAIVDARRVAVVGASADPNRIGGRPIKYLQQAGFSGEVIPVNSQRTHVQGLSGVAALEDVGPCDVVLLARPLREAPAIIETCDRLHIPAVIAFGSSGEDQATVRRLKSALSETSVRLVGPGSLGIASSPQQLVASFASSYLVPGALPLDPEANVSLVTQSGAVGAIVSEQLRTARVRVRHWFSPGEELDIGFADFVQFLADDDGTDVVGLYIEAMSDPSSLSEALVAVRRAGKRLVIVKVGASSAGASAVMSHTGVMAGRHSPDDHFLRAHDAIHVSSLGAFIEVLKLLQQTDTVPSSHHLVTISGGLGVMAADVWEEKRLSLALVPQEAADRLRIVLPPFATIGNPLDVSGEVVQRPELLGEAMSALVDSAVGICVLLGLQHFTGMDLVRQLVDFRSRADAPFLSCVWLAAPAECVNALEDAGIPVFSDIETAAEALALTAGTAHKLRQTATEMPLAPDAGHGPLMDAGVEVMTERAAKTLLQRSGVAVPESTLISTAAEVPDNLFPYSKAVVKVLSPAPVHKYKMGLMHLDLVGWEDVACSILEIAGRADRLGLEVHGYLVEEQLDLQQEYLVSAVRDPRLGEYLMVMRGGLEVEAGHATPTYLFPMIGHAHGGAQRDGGLERSCPEPILGVGNRLMDLLGSDSAIQQVELNPVGLLKDGSAVAVDAVIVRAR